MQPRFLILGAGITGAALAHRLTTLGASVTVVDAMPPASGATGRSFGWVNASFYLSPAHFHLRLAGMAAHRALAIELGLPPARQGCLWYEDQGTAFDTAHHTLSALGYPLRLLDHAQVAALEPALAAPPDRALLFPTESALDLPALTKGLLTAATARGAGVVTGTGPATLLQHDGRVSGIRTASADMIADHTILATGTGTPALLAPLGLAFPMLHRPGAIFRSQPLPPLLSHILATPEQEVRQLPSGALVAPASAGHQADSTETPPDPQSATLATLARLRAMFPAADIRADALTLAERPVPGDGLPAIGRVTDGLSMAVMHSGATLAAVVADLFAAELMGQGDQPALAPFRPERFWA